MERFSKKPEEYIEPTYLEKGLKRISRFVPLFLKRHNIDIEEVHRNLALIGLHARGSVGFLDPEVTELIHRRYFDPDKKDPKN